MGLIDLFKKRAAATPTQILDEEPQEQARQVRPVHSDRYLELKNSYDRMHEPGNEEKLAVYELFCRACRAGNMRLISNSWRRSYSFYSPLLLGPVYIEVGGSDMGNDIVRIKIGEGDWFAFFEWNLAFMRVLKVKQSADKELSRRWREKDAKRDAEQAAKRTRQKEYVLNLLADVRTRQGR